MTTDEARRRLAGHLWDLAGRPPGRDAEFWHAAGERLRHHLDRHTTRPGTATPTPPGVSSPDPPASAAV